MHEEQLQKKKGRFSEPTFIPLTTTTNVFPCSDLSELHLWGHTFPKHLYNYQHRRLAKWTIDDSVRDMANFFQIVFMKSHGKWNQSTINKETAFRKPNRYYFYWFLTGNRRWPPLSCTWYSSSCQCLGSRPIKIHSKYTGQKRERPRRLEFILKKEVEGLSRGRGCIRHHFPIRTAPGIRQPASSTKDISEIRRV